MSERPSELGPYHTDYCSGTYRDHYWSADGPGVHVRCENRYQAYAFAAALNAAYALGFADRQADALVDLTEVPSED